MTLPRVIHLLVYLYLAWVINRTVWRCLQCHTVLHFHLVSRPFRNIKYIWTGSACTCLNFCWFTVQVWILLHTKSVNRADVNALLMFTWNDGRVRIKTVLEVRTKRSDSNAQIMFLEASIPWFRFESFIVHKPLHFTLNFILWHFQTFFCLFLQVWSLSLRLRTPRRSGLLGQDWPVECFQTACRLPTPMATGKKWSAHWHTTLTTPLVPARWADPTTQRQL